VKARPQKHTMDGPETADYWRIVSTVVAWYSENAAPTGRLAEALAVAATIYLVSQHVARECRVTHPADWTAPPDFALIGVLHTWLSSGELAYRAATGDPPDIMYPGCAGPGTVRWMVTGAGCKFDLSREGVPADASLEKILARGRALTAAFAPFLLAVQPALE